MRDANDATTPQHPERRKYRRFDLQYPVHGTFASGDKVSDFDAISRNVSIGGLLMETASEISPHSLVSFTVVLQGGLLVRPLHLVGKGKAVRVAPAAPEGDFTVAVACKRPIGRLLNFGSGVAV